jgi:hypothetical protein
VAGHATVAAAGGKRWCSSAPGAGVIRCGSPGDASRRRRAWLGPPRLPLDVLL